METSILKTTKKLLGVGEDDDSFDLDIITHINTAFSTLHQLGVGPDDGFAVEDDDADWNDFIVTENPLYNPVKTYVGLRVRMLFDPPTSSFLMTSMENQILELTWRLNVLVETGLVLPTVTVIDGGDPDDI